MIWLKQTLGFIHLISIASRSGLSGEACYFTRMPHTIGCACTCKTQKRDFTTNFFFLFQRVLALSSKHGSCRIRDKSHTQVKLLAIRFYYMIACLIKICVYSHVTIKQRVVADY